jgi:hypothetical protein
MVQGSELMAIGRIKASNPFPDQIPYTLNPLAYTWRLSTAVNPLTFILSPLTSHLFHFPLKTGFLFSINAMIPSRASSVAAISTIFSDRKSTASSKGMSAMA